MNTSETLNKAADYIKQYGWQQGGPGGVVYPWGTEGTAACLEGGICAASGIEREDGLAPNGLESCPAYLAVKDYLADPMEDWMPVYRWNDKPGRTAEEVIEVLRAAAVIEQAREESTVKQLVEVTA